MEEMGHLLVFGFLFFFGAYTVAPAITDVTMEALCPGRDECSLAIYLTGLQQAMTGLGALVATPVVGNLSDRYGRKALLLLPATASILPSVILACNRGKAFFYAYYITNMVAAMVAEGSMQCLCLAYVTGCPKHGGRRLSACSPASAPLASSPAPSRRASSLSLVHFSLLDHASLWPAARRAGVLLQVSAVAAVAAAVYMRAFVQETDWGARAALLLHAGDEEAENSSRPLCLPSSRRRSSSDDDALSPMLPPLRKSLSLSLSLSEAAALLTSSKNQYANLMLVVGIAGSLSQVQLFYLILW
ncbi:hypothetical protein GUJ93_ZPchr0010g8851 [Zizania palustris]|uniref:Major facilitator superfamily (MFS) profile domain-containing protein n=1 Tax=Zizania palustris TaxID=103762 RepID=A0A8J5W9S9_ZIZPA|nr:hypothetical protein GUJ93_ZPchr0010g8851 [Zizania palustris]